MNVGTLCRREVVTVDSEEGLTQAARLMRQRHVGLLVVVESNADNADLKVVGVLTDRDIVTAVVAKEADVRSLRVGDVMSRNPLLAGELSSLESILSQMKECGVRRVPVVGNRNQLVGVLSVDDVLDCLAGQLSTVAHAIRSEQQAERTARP